MKKRLTALLLVLCLCLCACGKEEVPETTAPTVPQTTAAPETTEAPTEPPVTEPPTEATEPVLMANPLTGKPLDAPYTGRPVASTMNNAPAAMPQYGNSQADWLFEVETEGGVTRCMVVFTNPTEVNTIGPVRSARTYFISLSTSFGAPLAHCGGSYMAAEGQHAYGQHLDDYRDIDEMAYSSYFFRDSTRLSQGYSFEHTLFTTGEKLAAAMETKGYDDVLDADGVDYGLHFVETPSVKGDAAKDIMITFLGGKKTAMHYNEETGLYEAAQYGGDWIDGATGEAMAFENVVVIVAYQEKLASSHSIYDLYEGGNGYFASGGKITPITWSRDDVHQPFTFTLPDGSPVEFTQGRTYTAVIALNGSVSYE